MSTTTSETAPDLGGIRSLPEGARTIWRPAHPSNYHAAVSRPYSGATRRVIALCYHTPEEPWDNNEITPLWFEDPRANASTNYYADSDGDLYQMVRDEDFAWAQGVRRQDLVLPRPSWWRDEYVSYNVCMLSIEIEGYAREIGETFVRGSRQFETVAAWSAHVCRKYDVPIARSHHVGHSELTRLKTDPGRDFPWHALLDRVRELSDPETRIRQLERRLSALERHTHGVPQATG